MRTFGILAFGAMVGIVAGCFLKPPVVKPTEPPQSSKVYPDPASLRPDALPYTTARLILAGTPVPVDMSRSAKGSDVLFQLVAKKELVEEERYQIGVTSFDYVGLSDESYAPPIPIVMYPLRVGDAWNWKGTAVLGDNKKPATAAVRSSAETVNLDGGVYDCVKIVAELVVESGGTGRSLRSLTFWIQPTKGIIKREFGFSSTREPRPSGSP